MGNRQSGEQSMDVSKWLNISLKQRRLHTDITENYKEMGRLQKKILAEYPFLGNVWESTLITDNRIKDCPIVYANDEFERLSGYPKDEIVGRNCRFMQGKHTNRETVRQIREAVHEGKELEVELLNYRKDGVPFMNNFLMLPVHAFKNKGKPSHFIAIQKDITAIRLNEKNCRDWNPTEVSMWIDHIGFDRYCTLFLAKDIRGDTLLDLDEGALLNLGILITKDRKRILKDISALAKNPTDAFNDAFDRSEVLSEFQNKSFQAVDQDTQAGINHDIDLDHPRQLDNIWKQENKTKRIAFKCYYKDDIKIIMFTHRQLKTYKSFMRRIREEYEGAQMKVNYVDDDGDMILVESLNDVKAAIDTAANGTVILKLEKSDTMVRTQTKQLLNALNRPCVMVQASGHILFANKAFKHLVGKHSEELFDAKLVDYVRNYDLLGIQQQQIIEEKCEPKSVKIKTPSGKVKAKALQSEAFSLMFVLEFHLSSSHKKSKQEEKVSA